MCLARAQPSVSLMSRTHNDVVEGGAWSARLIFKRQIHELATKLMTISCFHRRCLLGHLCAGWLRQWGGEADHLIAYTLDSQ